MSSLLHLLNTLCPQEVRYYELGSVTNVLRGKRLTKKMLAEDGEYPVYHGGLDPMGFYNDYNRTPGTVMVINVGVSAGTVGYCEREFWSSDGCYCIDHCDLILDKYMFHWLSNSEPFLKSQVRVAGIPTLNRKVLQHINVAVPSIEIQKEIVRILDSFVELPDVLEKEIGLRKQQFEYCQYVLFKGSDSAERIKLSECCNLEKGRTPIQKAVPGEYPLVVTTSQRKSSSDYQFDQPTVCVPLVSSRGHGVACLNQIYYQEGKFALGNILCGVTPQNSNFLSAEYLYYYLNFKKDVLIVPLMKGGANVSLTVNALRGVEVVVPPIEEQNRMIAKLKPFEELINEISKEIKMRKEQFSYFRRKLFKCMET